MEALHAYIDKNQDLYVQRLAEAVAIPSVSGDPERRNDCHKMMHYTKKIVESYGFTAELKPLGMQTFPDGTQAELPPVIFAQLGNDPKKPTLCAYGHLDVQPALMSDGWDTEPFVLKEIDGKLYGRGSTDDKGPALGWLWAVEAYQKNGVELPINLKLCFEGMEESGSVGLEELIAAEAKKFFADVDFFVISDNYWLGQDQPCLTYGLRGLVYWYLTIESSTKDLHSGVFGGTVHESMNDLVMLMSKLVDNKGNILIPGIMDSVAPLSDEEKKMYDILDFDLKGFAKDAGVQKLIHDTHQKTLMHRWRFPALSLHGVEGAYYEPGSKTVIPRKVIGKFSMRIVPNQKPEEVHRLCKKYIEEEFAKLNSPNKMTIEIEDPGKPWVSDSKHPNFVAAAKAVKSVYGVDPVFTREGGSIPITLAFEENTGKNCCLLPIGQSDDGAHSQNEKISRRNYINGIKLFISYMDEVGKISK
eukprot:Nk52_evm17s372 gene=Nk52_evmTU17s372